MSESNHPIIRAIQQAEEPFTKLVKDSGFKLAFKREAMFAKRIVEDSKLLQNAEPQSIFRAVLDAATLGLTLNPAFQYATIIPRNVKVGGKDSQQWVTRGFLMPMYRGLVALAVEDGVIVTVEADVVYEADKSKGVWKFQRGIRPILEHTPHMGADRTTTPFWGVWTKAIVRELGPEWPIINFTPAEDIYKARDASDAYRDKKTGELSPDAPWAKWFGEQAKKVGVKRDQKLWPHVSQRMALAVEMDNKAQHSGITIEGEADEVIMITHEQVQSLDELLLKAKLRPEKFCETFGIDGLNQLPAERFSEAKERLEKRATAATATATTTTSASPAEDSQPMTDEERAAWRAELDRYEQEHAQGEP
jgi:recombination protein RecT